MGIKIKRVHLKPGTPLLEGVNGDIAGYEEKDWDSEGWAWLKVRYVGFCYELQAFYCLLEGHYPENNLDKVLPKLPMELKPEMFEFENGIFPSSPKEIDLIEPDEAVIGYDFEKSGLMMNEYVGEIRFKPWTEN